MGWVPINYPFTYTVINLFFWVFPQTKIDRGSVPTLIVSFTLLMAYMNEIINHYFSEETEWVFPSNVTLTRTIQIGDIYFRSAFLQIMDCFYSGNIVLWHVKG